VILELTIFSVKSFAVLLRIIFVLMRKVIGALVIQTFD